MATERLSYNLNLISASAEEWFFPKATLIIAKDVRFIQKIDQTIINNPFYWFLW